MGDHKDSRYLSKLHLCYYNLWWFRDLPNVSDPLHEKFVSLNKLSWMNAIIGVSCGGVPIYYLHNKLLRHIYAGRQSMCRLVTSTVTVMFFVAVMKESTVEDEKKTLDVLVERYESDLTQKCPELRLIRPELEERRTN